MSDKYFKEYVLQLVDFGMDNIRKEKNFNKVLELLKNRLKDNIKIIRKNINHINDDDLEYLSWLIIPIFMNQFKVFELKYSESVNEQIEAIIKSVDPIEDLLMKKIIIFLEFEKREDFKKFWDIFYVNYWCEIRELDYNNIIILNYQIPVKDDNGSLLKN